MSGNASDLPKNTAEFLSSRVQHLEKWIAEVDRQNIAKRKNYLIFGTALTAVCIVSFSFFTSNLFKFDTETAAALGRQEVERQLPSGVAGLKEYLKLQAPRIVSEMLRSALQLIPQFRAVLLQEVNSRTQSIKEEFESKLFDAMQEAIRSSKESVDKLDKNKSDVEKLELLVAQVSEDFKNLSQAALHELRPHYASEMNRVQSFLADLHHKSDSELTSREKTQKELIQTLLLLMIWEERKDR